MHLKVAAKLIQIYMRFVCNSCLLELALAVAKPADSSWSMELLLLVSTAAKFGTARSVAGHAAVSWNVSAANLREAAAALLGPVWPVLLTAGAIRPHSCISDSRILRTGIYRDAPPETTTSQMFEADRAP